MHRCPALPSNSRHKPEGNFPMRVIGKKEIFFRLALISENQ
jgi:hypothetical protein